MELGREEDQYGRIGRIFGVFGEGVEGRELFCFFCRGRVVVAAVAVFLLPALEAAIHSGASPGEAGQRSGVPPFRVSEVAEVVRSVPRGTLSVWMRLLAEADIALKSSRRPAQAVLETMLLEMCQG